MDNLKLAQLQAFFSAAILPDSIALGPGETISDIPKFLESHFAALQAACPSVLHDAYSARLLKLKNLL